MIELSAGQPRPLPLAQAVYHDYTQFLGSSTDFLEEPGNVVVKQGLALSWGVMPGSTHNWSKQNGDGAAGRKYVKKLAHAYRAFSAYLVHGQMLAPPRLSSGENLEDDIGRTEQIKTKDFQKRPFTLYHPALSASAWASPVPGAAEVGILVVSLSYDVPHEVAVAIDREALGVGSTALRYKLRSVDYDANEVLSIGDGCPWQEVPADDRFELRWAGQRCLRRDRWMCSSAGLRLMCPCHGQVTVPYVSKIKSLLL